MGKTATTLGVALVLVVLGAVVLIVFTGGDRSPQAGAKPTQTASADAGKNPVDAKSRIKSSIKPSSLSMKTALGQGDKKLPPPPAVGAGTSSDPAPKINPAPKIDPGPKTEPAPGGTAPAPLPSPGDAAKSPPALAAGAGAPPPAAPPPAAGTTDANVKTGDASTTTPLLDPAAYLQELEKKRPPATAPDARTPAPDTLAGGSVPGAPKTGDSVLGMPGAAPAAGTAAVDLAKPDYTTYVTQKDDTLWVLAVRFFQDGTKWQEIVKANPGLPPDGRMLPEGYHLRIPPLPATPAAVPPPPPANTVAYTIKPGDKLWNLALSFYGDGTLYKEILAANPGLDGARLSVDKVIYLPVIPGKGPKGLSPAAPPAKS